MSIRGVNQASEPFMIQVYAGANECRPLVVADPAPAAGWYTVIVSNWDLVPTIGKFVLKYGRYPTGNPNGVVPAAASAATFDRASTNSAKPRGQSN